MGCGKQSLRHDRMRAIALTQPDLRPVLPSRRAISFKYMCTSIGAHPLLGRLVSNAAGAQLMQKLLRGHEERVLVEDAADDEHRMGAHDINDNPSAKPGEVVGADDRVMVALPSI